MSKLFATDLLSEQKPDSRIAAIIEIRWRIHPSCKSLFPEFLFDLIPTGVPDISSFDEIDHIL
jgi:hypothetical protein